MLYKWASINITYSYIIVIVTCVDGSKGPLTLLLCLMQATCCNVHCVLNWPGADPGGLWGAADPAPLLIAARVDATTF